jgi:hypothetical protein
MQLLLLSLLLAVQTPTPTPALPRLALVVSTAGDPAMQPNFERFAIDAAMRFAKQFSVGVQPEPGSDRPQFANPAFCGPLGVAGFLIPGRRWHINSEVVSSTVSVVIFDCDGDRFFQQSADFTELRNQAMIPGAQIDDASSHALDLLLAKFARFVSGHQVLWSRLLATGSLRAASPSPSTSP